MQKGTRLIKRLVALFLVLLLSIESFAAVVSDNDGSAFITKAEFDSLKNNFQSQIDQYNTSIDSKIDGAIASYLAGIKLSSTEEVKTIYAPVDGVISLSANDLNWKEGLMDLKLYGDLFRYNKAAMGQGFFTFIAANTGATSFYEPLVYDISSTGYARFGGYQRTKQYSVLNGLSTGPYNFQQQSYTTIVTCFAGTFPVSNVTLTTDNTDPLFMVGFLGNAEGPDLYSWNQIRYYGNQCSFRREIQNTDSNTFVGGLVLNSASLPHKFCNNDGITDWCNDDTTTGHTYFSRWNHINLTGTGTSYKIIGINDTTVTNVTLDNTTSYSTDSRSEEGTLRRPYFGFANQVGNWNKIYDANLDLQYNEILPNTDANKGKNTIVNKGANHIKLGAGLPIISVVEDDKVTYEFNFKDKTVDYAVWVKIGSFDSTKNLADDKDDVITKFTTYGNTEYNSAWKALKIVNGVGKCTFTAEEKGVVFMKWSLASATSTDGGGILYPAEKVVVEHTG